MIPFRRKRLNMALFAAAAILLAALLREICKKPAEAQMVCGAGPVVVVCSKPLGGNTITGGKVPLGGHPSVPLGGIVSGAGVGGNAEYRLYLLDTTTHRVLVYIYNPERNYLGLAAGRNVTEDLWLTQYHNKGCSVQQAKELGKKGPKE